LALHVILMSDLACPCFCYVLWLLFKLFVMAAEILLQFSFEMFTWVFGNCFCAG